MGKTINKGPCYCCEQSSSVTSSVSSSTSSVTSSASHDFCCTPGGSVNGVCAFSHGMAQCSWYTVQISYDCKSFNNGVECGEGMACFENMPPCVKEVYCFMPSTVFCGPWDNTNCGFFGDAPWACIGTLDVGDRVTGHCVSFDTRAGSPCPSTTCTCGECHWLGTCP